MEVNKIEKSSQDVAMEQLFEMAMYDKQVVVVDEDNILCENENEDLRKYIGLTAKIKGVAILETRWSDLDEKTLHEYFRSHYYNICFESGDYIWAISGHHLQFVEEVEETE